MESYFDPRRVRGKKGRGAIGKSYWARLKRGGKVYVQLVKNCSKAELMPLIEGKILEGSTIHTDGWRAYAGLILNGYAQYRVFQRQDEFSSGESSY